MTEGRNTSADPDHDQAADCAVFHSDTGAIGAFASPDGSWARLPRLSSGCVTPWAVVVGGPSTTAGRRRLRLTLALTLSLGLPGQLGLTGLFRHTSTLYGISGCTFCEALLDAEVPQPTRDAVVVAVERVDVEVRDTEIRRYGKQGSGRPEGLTRLLGDVLRFGGVLFGAVDAAFFFGFDKAR